MSAGGIPPRAGRGWRHPGVPVAVGVLAAAAAGWTAAAVAGAPALPALTAPPPLAGRATATTADAAGGVTLTDSAGDRFTVTATAVQQLPVVTVHGALWSAAPGQAFLQAQIQVTNPTTRPEALASFDDPSSGLAPALDFVTNPSDATRVGDRADCGADPAYPSTLCPVSFPQRLTVDDDSADTAGATVVLPPGATARLSCSYGPVPAGVAAASFSVWFAGPPLAVDLTP